MTSLMIVKRLGSTIFWLFIVASSFALIPFALLIWAVTRLFDRRLAVLHQFTCLWASMYTWLNPVWRVTVEGRDKIKSGVTYVMVANHQSLVDILVLFRLFVHFKWVSKIENFYVPAVGWNMWLNRYIPLRRGDKQSIDSMMDACDKTLRSGNSIMMFPEGTRSVDGKLKAFKHGAFTLAKRAQVPILPIIIEGTARALPKRGFVLQGRHAIRVRVLDAVSYQSFKDLTVESLTEKVRGIIAAELEPSDLDDDRNLLVASGE